VEKIENKFCNFLVLAIYCLDSKIMQDEMVGAYSMHLEIRNVYRILVEKPEAGSPLRRRRHAWEGNIKMDLRINLRALDSYGSG
jgi:hypothetical protein